MQIKPIGKPTVRLDDIQRVVILGASFDTGNLGVSALAWSSIKLILNRWDKAEVCIVGTGRQPAVYVFRDERGATDIPLWPVRYTPKIWVSNHILQIWFALLLVRFLPVLAGFFRKNQNTLGALLGADLVCDITGGDSFSDIYGMERLLRDVFLKRCCLLLRKPFVMLPQTYGPFKSLLSRVLVRNVLRQVRIIYSRDQEGLTTVNSLIGYTDKSRLCPDVAFVMDPMRPKGELVETLENVKAGAKQLVGLNISGLLYNGGYTQNNMFDLACDYPSLVKKVISYFVCHQDVIILLVPHVIPDDFAVENDYTASQKVLDTLSPEEREKVIVLDGNYDQNQAKYIIGLCDFFMGARMHATIAALSQCVPAIGMAYSKKFAGVFKTAGIENCVVDMRNLDKIRILDHINDLYLSREAIRQQLASTMPHVKRQIYEVFKSI